ncbi:MAG: hypothetical protein HYT76_02940 [Deltaproteobacteria bacterium]|nr:hypothetical protein [Deltaproteobacteria bacterium]
MNKIKTGVAVVALITAAAGGPAWGWGNINATNNMNKYDQRVDNRQDKRDFSDHRVTNTTDSRDMSNHQSWSDSRNQSTNTTTSTANSHNTTNKQQYGDRSGGAMFKDKVNLRAGHDTVNFGTVSGGTGNVMDASVNGNTFVIGNGSN